MRAELKSLFSHVQTKGGLEHYVPDDPEHFGIHVMAFIGTDDDDKFDSFDAFVCTPSWFAEHFGDDRRSSPDWEPHGLKFGNRYVFMERWDYIALHAAISGLCAQQEAADWGTLADRIGRHIPWEFAYKYDDYVDKTADQRPEFPPSIDE
jgi:hypothetical protein